MNAIKSAKDVYCIVYRMGGTANFHWQHTLGMSLEEAKVCKESTERMGYKALLYKYSDLLNVGMPETYNVNSPLP